MSGWPDQGLCAQADPEEWFPEKGGSTRAAKKICAACPVQEPCLAYSLIAPEWFGVWGGLSVQERRLQYPDAFARGAARRNRGRQGCGTDSGYQRHKSDGEAACPACLEAAARAREARDKAREVPA